MSRRTSTLLISQQQTPPSHHVSVGGHYSYSAAESLDHNTVEISRDSLETLLKRTERIKNTLKDIGNLSSQKSKKCGRLPRELCVCALNFCFLINDPI